MHQQSITLYLPSIPTHIVKDVADDDENADHVEKILLSTLQSLV